MNKYEGKLNIRSLLVMVLLVLFALTFTSCGKPSSLNEIKKTYNFPNPFEPTSVEDSLKKTIIRVQLANNTKIKDANLSIEIQDSTGCDIWAFNKEITLVEKEQNIDTEWFGKNGEGKIVSQGFYTAKIKIKSLESNGIHGGDTLTDEIKIAVK